MLLTSCLGLEPPKAEEVKKDLMIQEVFYFGTENEVVWPSGYRGIELYNMDSYIRIYNPTDEVMYLDGLCLARGAFANDLSHDLKGDENFAATHVAVDRLLMFPGSGKEYPIRPREFKTITAVAIDHTLSREEMEKRYTFVGDPEDSHLGDEYANGASAKAANLESADFEWLSPEQMSARENSYCLVDNNDVPNLIPLFAGFVYLDQKMMTESPFQIPDNNSLLLVRLGIKPEELDQPLYWWDYETGHNSSIHNEDLPYHKRHEKGDAHAVKIPNEWVVDAITICDQDRYKRQRLDDTIDGGYTSVRINSGDKTGFGYALVRRHDGEGYVDSNNSMLDFEKQPATMLAIKPKKLLYPNITIESRTVTLKVGDAPVRMTWVIKPKRTKHKQVAWTSSEPTVATIDDKGFVTAVSPGTAIIAGTLANGDKDTCTVTVLAK